METCSPLCRRPIKARVHRRLRRRWWRPGASVRSIAQGNRARSKRKRIPRWNPLVGKETQFPRTEVAPFVKEKSPLRPSPVSRKFLPNDPSTAIGLDLANRRHHDGAPNKRRKYEEPHSPHYLGAIDRDDCAAGTHFVCSKRGCDVKGSGDSTTA